MEAVYIEFKHKRMLLISRLDEKYCEFLPHMDADILVLCNNLQTDIPAMLTRFNASRVIADGSMYPSFVRKIETACKKEGIRFHSTKKLGFFSY